MAQARTTVIIPVRNGAKFVAAAIGSALAQLDQADEVIVIDDASNDDTRAVVASVQDCRVRLLKGSGRGVSSARNIGLAAAAGEFVAFLDHDDLWPPERHRILSSILIDNPELDAVYGHWRTSFDGIKPISTWQGLDGKERLLNSLCTSLFRRRALDRIGGFDEGMRFVEDVDYLLRLRETGSRMQACDAHTLIYRRHSTNSTCDQKAAHKAAFEFLRRRIEWHRARNANVKSSAPSMMHARTSVIIPVRNGTKFVAEAIHSALAQLDRADEVIVIDDASTDDTRAVVASVQDSRVRLLKGSGRGVSSARNIGLAAATGEFIAFLDHDDFWPPERHKVLSSMLINDQGLDAVNGRIRVRFDGVEPTPQWQVLDGDYPRHSVCTSLFRRRALDRIGVFDEALRFAEDADYVLRLRDAGSRMQSCDVDVLIYRRHSTNATRDGAAAHKGVMQFFHRRIVRRRMRNTGTEK